MSDLAALDVLDVWYARLDDSDYLAMLPQRWGSAVKKTRPAKLTGIVAVRGWPGKHLDRDGTGYAGFARAVAARDGDADPSMPRGWPTPARARRSGAAASR